MNEHHHSADKAAGSGGFWSSWAGLTLIAFLAVAGLLLAYEHRVHLFTGGGLLVVLLGLCVLMHAFMHGGHGGHGSRGGNEPGQRRQ